MLSFSPAPLTHALHELHWKVFIEKMLQGNRELSLWFGKEEIEFSQMVYRFGSIEKDEISDLQMKKEKSVH